MFGEYSDLMRGLQRAVAVVDEAVKVRN